MSAMFRIALLLSLWFLGTACERRDLTHRGISYQTRILSHVRSSGPKVPIEIANYVGAQGEGILSRKNFPLKIYIYPTSSGVLAGPIQVVIPDGYGELDLASLVSQRRGSFRFLLEPDLGGADLRRLRVFYWPQTHSQGCLSFYDVTPQFRQQWMNGGFELRSDDGHYLDFLGGLLFFLVVEENQIKFSSVRVYDSRYPELFCNEQGDR